MSPTEDTSIKLNKAEIQFTKTIPYKVYLLDYGNVSGTTPHTHDYVQIWYVLDGSCGHVLEDTTYDLTKGSLFILPPFVSHMIQPKGETNLKIFGCEFSTSFVDETIHSIADGHSGFDAHYLKPIVTVTRILQPNLTLSSQAVSEVESLFTHMLREYTFERKYYELNIKTDLTKLLVLLARENDDRGSLPENVSVSYKENMSKAISYINNHYSDRIYVEDICKIAAMSKTYFSHYFKLSTGKTFVEYMNHLRIRKAMVLLTETRDSILEICNSCGYHDNTYFSRVFKKETGLSPGQYRQKITE